MREGCGYGKVTRQIVVDIKEDVASVKNDIQTMRGEMKELFNHQSSRLPMWATILFTIGGSLITGLIIYVLTN